jgi:hypothetical protein
MVLVLLVKLLKNRQIQNKQLSVIMIPNLMLTLQQQTYIGINSLFLFQSRLKIGCSILEFSGCICYR